MPALPTDPNPSFSSMLNLINKTYFHHNTLLSKHFILMIIFYPHFPYDLFPKALSQATASLVRTPRSIWMERWFDYLKYNFHPVQEQIIVFSWGKVKLEVGSYRHLIL